jgi:hypothetical protein
MENSNGNRIRDLPACSEVAEPAAPPLTPRSNWLVVLVNTCTCVQMDEVSYLFNTIYRDTADEAGQV